MQYNLLYNMNMKPKTFKKYAKDFLQSSHFLLVLYRYSSLLTLERLAILIGG